MPKVAAYARGSRSFPSVLQGHPGHHLLNQSHFHESKWLEHPRMGTTARVNDANDLQLTCIAILFDPHAHGLEHFAGP